ncbi:glycosyltransferase family 39 protein [Bradyrhizobium prioriisuperbiae]|uniref:glycosyltransferase family 39 protein n=1 Tax=Bradyrhizobium prioriisuperbiae TaxID=2854389 RepID=UPI0028F03B5F|nr:glycosyltransferase family 39 protein [Bradyrhizobium prioritasuperba]
MMRPVVSVPAGSWRRPFDAWLDGIEDGWAIPALLSVFVALWMAILQLAYLSGDLHPDVIEAWTLGQSPAWGGIKHPPLMGWIARAWTTVFPVADWSFHLLAMTNAAIGLWAIDLIVRRFVRGDTRGLIVLLLLLLPVYQFQAQRFNANAMLLALWPLTIYCFLRSFEMRQFRWALAAGIAGALAMLGKYYSVFLILGFVIGAVCHPQRRAYFASMAPWISAIAGVALLAPHAHWHAISGISPFDYALAAHGGQAMWASVKSAGGFWLGVAATLALPLLVWAALARSKREAYMADLRKLDPGLLLLLSIAVATIIVPPLVTIMLKSSITSTWAAQGLFLFVVVAVCAAKFSVDRIDIDRLAAVILLATCVALVCAPIHAFYRNTHPFKEGRNYYKLASHELMRQWRKVSTTPLAAASGDKLAMALSFYSPDHPLFVVPYDAKYEWQVPAQEVLRKGWATICLPDEATCLVWSKMVAGLAAGAVLMDFDVQPRLWGRPGVSTRISAVMVPPQR